MKSEKKIKSNCIFFIAGIFIIILTIFDTSAYNVKIHYGDDPLNKYVALWLNTSMETERGDNVLSEEKDVHNYFFYGIISSSQWSRKNNKIQLVINNENIDNTNVKIKYISFRYLFFNVCTINSTNFDTFFKTEQETSVLENGEVEIKTPEKKAMLFLESNQLLLHGNITQRILGIKISIIAFVLLILFVFLLIDCKCKSPEYIKWCVILGIVLLFVSCMSILGEEYASPDETVSSESVKYYYTHWGLPDYQSEDVKGTISNRGYSRLKEITPYYFIAGKIGRIFDTVQGYKTSYRIINLLLFFILISIFIRYGKKNKWLLMSIVITPQLWYLFSYTTSDAWDYFISFIIILLLIVDTRIKRRYLFSVIRGILFFLLFCGKQNYYVIALFAFIVFLIELTNKKKSRKEVIIEYGIILLTTGILFGGRLFLDYVWYGGEKQHILSEIYKVNKQVNIIPMIDRGLNLSDMMTNTTLAETLYKSFVGFYGWLTFKSGIIYYWSIGIIYICLIIYVTKYCIKEHIVETATSFGMIAVAFFLVLYHCWTSDFQPQGRYMFGIIPCLMYLVSREKKLYEGKQFEYIMQIIVILSMISFVRYGMTVII